MLFTELKHMESAKELKEFINNNDKVVICCGRMGPMCIPVYKHMETLEKNLTDVKFADMEFDNPEAHVIRNAPECNGFMSLPFTVYYKKGEMVKATSGIQSMEQLEENIQENLLK